MDVLERRLSSNHHVRRGLSHGSFGAAPGGLLCVTVARTMSEPTYTVDYIPWAGSDEFSNLRFSDSNTKRKPDPRLSPAVIGAAEERGLR
jgi:hypothetical protein